MGVRADVRGPRGPIRYTEGAAPPEDYAGPGQLRDWRPRRVGTGDGAYHGSNVDLGTPDQVVDDLREKLLEMDDLLAYAAEVNARLRSAKAQKIMMRAELLSKCPLEHKILGKIKSASVREQWLELQMAEVLAEEADCKIAWELVQRAGRTHEAQLDGIRSIGARVGSQYANDGREGFGSYGEGGERQRRRELAAGAGKRMPGH